MRDGLYSPAKYMPKLNLNDKDILLTYTQHATERAQEKTIRLPRIINPTKGKIVEIEIRASRLVKIVIESPYNVTQNLTLVIATDTAIVKTAWLNNKTDHHATLDLSRYEGKN